MVRRASWPDQMVRAIVSVIVRRPGGQAAPGGRPRALDTEWRGMTEVDPVTVAFHTAAAAAGAATPQDRLGWCAACVQVLAVDSAAILAMPSSGHPEVLGCSDERAARVADVQIMLGQGPAFEAFEQGHPILVPRVRAADSRWPMFPDALADRNGAPGVVGAMFAIPLQVGAIRR